MHARTRIPAATHTYTHTRACTNPQTPTDTHRKSIRRCQAAMEGKMPSLIAMVVRKFFSQLRTILRQEQIK